MRSRWPRGLFEIVVATALLGVATVVTASAQAQSGLYPAFEISTTTGTLGTAVGLNVNMFELDAAGDTDRVRIIIPGSFTGSIVDSPGSKLGTGGLGLRPAGGGGSITDYVGSLVVMSQSDYAANPVAQACDPGHHTAVWGLLVNNVHGGAVTVPIAVDPYGEGHSLTMCLAGTDPAKFEAADVYFWINGVFNTPRARGAYLFDATVTPFGSNDVPAPKSAYELRAYDALPEYAGAFAIFDAATKRLTVTGAVAIGGNAPLKNDDVQLYGSPNGADNSWTQIGTATTGSSGLYTYTRRLSRLPYRYLYAWAQPTLSPTCLSRGSTPGGCASTSVSGVDGSNAPILLNVFVLQPRTAPSDLSETVLSPSAISHLPGAPGKFTLKLLQGADIYASDRSFAPCGTTVEQVPYQSGALSVAVHGSSYAVFQWVDRLAPGRAAAYFQAEEADARPGCHAFSVADNTGGTQSARLIAIVRLASADGDQRLATIDRLGSGSTLEYDANVFVQRGDILLATSVASATLPSASFVKALADADAARVDELPIAT